MAKKAKVKNPKSSRKQPAVQEPELPSLVEAMAKLVERLESVERKVEQVLGRVSSLPSEFRNAVQQNVRPQPHQPSQPSHAPQHTHSNQPPQRPAQQPHPQHQGPQNPGNGNGGRDRRMFQAVCADCHKNCEVPFKPGDRPVYCKECFGLRKAGNMGNKGNGGNPGNALPLHTVKIGSQSQDTGRRSAVAHMNKKAGYAPGLVNRPSSPVSSGNTLAVKSAKPKKKKK